MFRYSSVLPISALLLLAGPSGSSFAAEPDTLPLIPFYGVKGDAAEIRQTVREIARLGNTGFVLQLPPNHPDYLGPKMWSEAAAAIDEAKKLHLEVYLPDEPGFPSGWAGGRLVQLNPDYTHHVILDRTIAVKGPTRGTWEIPGGVKEHDRILSVVAFAEHLQNFGEPYRENVEPVDLTSQAEGGGQRVMWDVPEGNWRICWSVTRPQPPEPGWHPEDANMSDVLNPEVAAAYIRMTHEAWWSHFSSDFGKTIQGFFSDETGLRNVASYSSLPGNPGMPMPWSPIFLDYFQRLNGYDPRPLLPALWYNLGRKGRGFRYDIMNAYTRAFSENWFKPQQDWCHAHGVKLIGHIIDDNHADHNLGYGSGHWFRTMRYFDYAGIDIIGSQVTPGLDAGMLPWRLDPGGAKFFWDQELFSFGLSAMVRGGGIVKSSNRVFAEAFCAYGSQSGWRTLNWVGDWLMVNGISVIDPCERYDRANGDPQWRYYPVWAASFKREQRIVGNSTPVVDVAVLFTGESAWVAPAQNSAPVVRVLEEHQITTAIIPYDAFATDGSFEDGRWVYNGLRFASVVLPYVYAIPTPVIRRLVEFAEKGGRVIVTEGWPAVSADARSDNAVKEAVQALGRSHNAYVVSTPAAVGLLSDVAGVEVAPATTSLVVGRRRDAGGEWLLLQNRSIIDPVQAHLAVTSRFGKIARYDPWEDRYYAVPVERNGGLVSIALQIPAYNMWMLRMSDNLPAVEDAPAFPLAVTLQGEWTVSKATDLEATRFEPLGKKTVLEDWKQWPGMEAFAGTVRYARTITLQEFVPGRTIGLDAGSVDEIAELRVNGKPAGVRIHPPYRWNITSLVHSGNNQIELDVTNTEQASRTDVFTHGQPVSGLKGPVVLLYEGK